MLWWNSDPVTDTVAESAYTAPPDPVVALESKSHAVKVDAAPSNHTAPPA